MPYTDAMPGQLKPSRFRFSLRTLFVLVTLLCVPMAWLGWRYQRAQRQERQITVLREHHGGASRMVSKASFLDRCLGKSFSVYSLDISIVGPLDGPTRPDPSSEETYVDRQWKAAVHTDYVVSLTIQGIHGDDAYTPAHGPYLESIESVTSIQLYDLDQHSMEHILQPISKLPKLESLEIYGHWLSGLMLSPVEPSEANQISREMMRQIARSPSLEKIFFWGVVFEEEAIQEMETNPRLKKIKFVVKEGKRIVGGIPEEQASQFQRMPNVELQR